MTRFNELHPSIRIRLFLQFATQIAGATIMPYIAIYFTGMVGAKITGILVILVICSGIAGGFVGGYWSDQIGRRKLMIAGELGIGISFLALAFVNSPWAVLPYVSFVLFLINMFCNGIYIPVSTSMIHDLIKKDERNFVFTVIYWIANLATALGTITGAFLFEKYHFYLFLAVAVVTLLSSLVTYLFIGETFQRKTRPDQPAEPSPSIWSTYRIVLKDRIYMFFLIGTLCVVSLESHLTNYIAVYPEKNIESESLFGWFTVDGMNMVGILHAENTLLVVLAVGLISWLVKKTPDNIRLLSGMILYVCSYSLLSFSTAPWLLIMLMIFISVGELMYIPVRQSLLAELADDSYRSSYLALNSFMGQGTMIIAGATITLGGILPGYLISGGFFVVGMTGVFLIRLVLRRTAGSSQEAQSKSV